MLDQMNYLARLSQEHGILKVAQNQFKNFNIGDLVEIIPVHSCLTANLMGHYRTTDGALIEMKKLSNVNASEAEAIDLENRAYELFEKANEKLKMKN